MKGRGVLVSAWCVFIAISYLPNAVPLRAFDVVGVTVFWSMFTTTLIILCDATTNMIEGKSLLTEVTAGRGAFARFALTGAVSGLMLDGIGQWLGKLWIYPHWNDALYGWTFVLGFCAYWLAIVETYLVARSLLGARRRRRQARARRLSRAAGAVGAVLLVGSICFALAGYERAGGYVFSIAPGARSGRPAPHAPFLCVLAAFAGCWTILEWAHSRRGGVTFMSSVLAGDRLPLCAVLAASATTSLWMETVNARGHFWAYTNWPLQDVTVAGAPVLALALWPVQYILFVSLYGMVTGDDVWAGAAAVVNAPMLQGRR